MACCRCSGRNAGSGSLASPLFVPLHAVSSHCHVKIVPVQLAFWFTQNSVRSFCPTASSAPPVSTLHPKVDDGPLPPTQVPDWQVSSNVHALPSLHAVPLALFGFEQTPVEGLHVPALWHWSCAVHVIAVPPQEPPWHVSLLVHLLPSSHVVPLALGGFEQVPVAASQVPTSWHWSSAVHTTAVPPQVPLWHVSSCVHLLPSSHVAPLALGGFEQVPVAASQVPTSWHWSCAVHTTAVPPQVPLWHVSSCVHLLPSSHVVPLALGGFEQVPVAASQVPTSWHWSSAVHVVPAPLVHVPLRHVSPVVQGLPSSHDVPSAFAGFEQAPVAGLHVPASWHWSCALHVADVPDVQAPAWHVSPTVHRLPSSHAAPLVLAGFEQERVVGSQVPAT